MLRPPCAHTPFLLLLLAGLAACAPIHTARQSSVVRRHGIDFDSVHGVESFQTTKTTDSKLGPVTEDCAITLTPGVGDHGEELVREDRFCTVTLLPLDGVNISSDDLGHIVDNDGFDGIGGNDNDNNDGLDSNSGDRNSGDSNNNGGVGDGADNVSPPAGGTDSGAPTSSADGAQASPDGNGQASGDGAPPPGAAPSSPSTPAPSAAPGAQAPSSPATPGSSAGGNNGAPTSSSASSDASATPGAQPGSNTPTPTSDGGSGSGGGDPAQSSASATQTAAAEQSSASGTPFSLPGQKLQVLPIGLGVFAGISVIALIVVGLVTYERTKYRKAFRQRRLAEQGQTPGYGGMSERPT